MRATKFLLSTILLLGIANAGGHVVQPVTNQLYTKECGSCHMAYQPALLNKESWRAMTNSLSKHFGTDASLEPKELKPIADYLAAEGNNRSQRVYESISAQEWFVKEHRELPKKYVTQPAVKSWANCAACHTKAASGDYRERNIVVPNYGRWKD